MDDVLTRPLKKQGVSALMDSYTMNTIESSALFTDTCNLLTKRQVGHMSQWAYLNGGRKYLEEFFKRPDYDGVREMEVIPAMARDLARHILSNPESKKISLIEIGPGRAALEKTGRFLDNVKDITGQQHILEYYALDIVQDYAVLAAQQIQDHAKIFTKSITADYTKLSANDINVSGTPIIISWNSPIWNAGSSTEVDPVFKNSNNLKKLGNLVNKKGMLYLTHFPINDGRNLEELYRDKNCENAVLAIAHLIERELNPECLIKANGKERKIEFSKAFHYDVYVDRQNEQLDMNLISNHDLTIKIGPLFEAEIKEGQRFTCVRSAKPSILSFNRLVRMCNAETSSTLQNLNGDVAAQALHFNP